MTPDYSYKVWDFSYKCLGLFIQSLPVPNSNISFLSIFSCLYFCLDGLVAREGLHLHGVQVPHIAGWKTQGEVALMRLPDSRALGLTNDVHKFMARYI